MIEKFGIGIDIIEVTKFRNKPFRNNETFYKKIFLPSEIDYCLRFKDDYKHFAAKFAVKEATKKAIFESIDFKEIETTHKNLKPIIILKEKKYNFLVSLSHEENVAVAVEEKKKKILSKI